MKGIILAGGSGTRLYPSTIAVCKQLLPIYDKPLIYYPLSTLMLSGIKDILIISTPQDTPVFEKLLGDGSSLGISLSYKVQKNPKGIADAFIVGESFIGKDPVCLVLGDNVFYGHGFSKILQSATQKTDIGSLSSNKEMAVVFGYYVQDPERYGVAEFDENKKVISIEEKPLVAKSNYAVTGLYFYPNSVIDIAKNLTPSPRGELEITDVNKEYLKRDQLSVELLGRGFAWLDTGTHSSMAEATNFIKTVEERQGLKVGCIEEVAYRMRFIDDNELKTVAVPLIKSGYGEYLLNLIGE